MTLERRDNDRQVEELRTDANQIETKVSCNLFPHFQLLTIDKGDGASEDERRGAQ